MNTCILNSNWMPQSYIFGSYITFERHIEVLTVSVMVSSVERKFCIALF